MGTKRIERLILLLQQLQRGESLTVDELAKAIKVSRRTVFRDLELLSRCGIPYEYDRVTQQYSTDRQSLLPPIPLSHGEALALLLAAKTMLRTPMMDGRTAASAAMKLEGVLPIALRAECMPILKSTDLHYSPASDPAAVADTLPMLHDELANSCKLSVTYDSYSEGKAIQTILHAYHLRYIHRGWYLIGFSELHEEVRTFKVERILRLAILKERFRVAKGFDIDEYFGNAWLMIKGDRRHHVRIRFRPKVAGNVDEIIWHRTQHTQWENGSLLFEVDVDGIDEIAWWVLSYGDQAEVLDPPELREAVLGHARRMIEVYAGNGNGHVGQSR